MCVCVCVYTKRQDCTRVFNYWAGEDESHLVLIKATLLITLSTCSSENCSSSFILPTWLTKHQCCRDESLPNQTIYSIPRTPTLKIKNEPVITPIQCVTDPRSSDLRSICRASFVIPLFTVSFHRSPRRDAHLRWLSCWLIQQLQAHFQQSVLNWLKRTKIQNVICLDYVEVVLWNSFKIHEFNVLILFDGFVFKQTIYGKIWPSFVLDSKYLGYKNHTVSKYL